jgi:hypothetical protein
MERCAFDMLRLIVPGSLTDFSSSSEFFSLNDITYHVVVNKRKIFISEKLRSEIEEVTER